MKIFSVFGTVPQVIKRLQVFLDENRFSKITIDHASNEITAERKVHLLWKESIHISVKAVLENVSNIEFKLKPLRFRSADDDENKENELQRNLYLYF